MTDLAALQAQKKTLTDAIAALSPDLGRPLPMRQLPSSAATRISALNKQLAVINMKLKQAEKAASSPAQ